MHLINNKKSKCFTTTNLFEAIASQNSTCMTSEKIDHEQWVSTIKHQQSKMIGINSSILQYLDEKYERLQMVSAHYKKLLCNALDAKKKYRHMIETIKKKHRQKIIYYRQEIQRLTRYVIDAKDSKKTTHQTNSLAFVPINVIPSHTSQSSSFLVPSWKSKDTKHLTKNELLFCNGDSHQTLYGVFSKRSSRCATITQCTIPPLWQQTNLICLFMLLPKKEETIVNTYLDKKKNHTYAIHKLDCINNIALQHSFIKAQKRKHEKYIPSLLFTSRFLKMDTPKLDVFLKETIKSENNQMPTDPINSDEMYHRTVLPNKLCDQYLNPKLKTNTKLTNSMTNSFDSTLFLEDLYICPSRLYDYQKFFYLSKSVQL